MCQLVCEESQKLLGGDAGALTIDTLCFDFDGTLLVLLCYWLWCEAGIFSGPALKRCVMRKVARATQVGMVGKLSKMAMGYFVTHVAGNKVDTAFLANLAAQCGATDNTQEEMRQASSARHFQEIAQTQNLLGVFPLMCQLVCEESQKLLGGTMMPGL